MGATKYIAIAAAVGGFLFGAAAGGYGIKKFYDGVVIPERDKIADEAKATAVADAKSRCETDMTAAISVAASTARAAEFARLQKLHNAALDEYRAALAEREERLQAAREEQLKRDRDHAKRLADKGMSCPITRDHIDYLTGVRPQTGEAGK
jgi:hypothetical protein